MKALYQTPEVERIEFAAMEQIAAAEGEAPGGTGGDNPSQDNTMS